MTPAAVVVAGYATLDYAMTLPSPPTGAGTWDARIEVASWPRAGGAALYAGRRLAAAGHRAAALVAIGDDANGAGYAAQCAQAGLAADGIAVHRAARTPACVLVHHDDGRYTCLLDRGSVDTVGWTPPQLALAADAELVVFSAVSAARTIELLATLRADQRVAWILKDDPECFPPELCALLAQRADMIFCNAGEAGMLASYRIAQRPGQFVVETSGGAGVRVSEPGMVTVLPVERIRTRDATGAGDTLAGETIAGVLAGKSAAHATRSGIEVVSEMLRDRARSDTGIAACE